MREATRKGKPLPLMAFNRFIQMAGKGEKPEHKHTLLSQILTGSDLSEKESERIWSKYLLSLSRFDLVKIFKKERSGIGNPKRGGPQQSFSFKAVTISTRSERGFRSRAIAIRALPKGKS